jgi:hypothetical protein
MEKLLMLVLVLPILFCQHQHQQDLVVAEAAQVKITKAATAVQES